MKLKDLKENYHVIGPENGQYNIYSMKRPGKRTNSLYSGTIEVLGHGKIKHIQTGDIAKNADEFETIVDKWHASLEYSPECYDPMYAYGYREEYMMFDWFERNGIKYSSKTDKFVINLSSIYNSFAITFSMEVNHEQDDDKHLFDFNIWTASDTCMNISADSVDEAIDNIKTVVQAVQTDMLVYLFTSIDKLGDSNKVVAKLSDSNMVNFTNIYDIKKKTMKDFLVEKLEKTIEILKK